jgi:uncharacterized protein HemY
MSIKRRIEKLENNASKGEKPQLYFFIALRVADSKGQFERAKRIAKHMTTLPDEDPNALSMAEVGRRYLEQGIACFDNWDGTPNG